MLFWRNNLLFSFSGPTRGIRHASAIFFRPLRRTQNKARCQNVRMGAHKTCRKLQRPNLPRALLQQLPVGRQTHLLQGSWGCETLLLSVPRHLVTLFPSLARELKLYRCPVALGFGRFEITYLTSESHSESYEERFSERLKPLLFYSRISFESPFPHAEVLSNAVQQVSSHRCIFAE